MANWLQLCRTPGSERRRLLAKTGLRLSRPPGRHSKQERYARQATDVPAGMIGAERCTEELGQKGGGEGMWHSQ